MIQKARRRPTSRPNPQLSRNPQKRTSTISRFSTPVQIRKKLKVRKCGSCESCGSKSLTTEHGNYSDGLRKGFQHENISYSRRQNKEYVELERPKFSVLLSGTPQQVLSLIPDAENGLFSRFIFYSLKMNLEWLNPFAERNDAPLEQYFTTLGEEFHILHQRLKSLKEPIQFQLTDSQIDSFNAYFARYQDTFNILFGEDIIASVWIIRSKPTQ